MRLLYAVSQKWVRPLVATTPIFHYTQQQRIRWFGHLTRMAPHQLASKAYNTKMSGYKARGRPRKTWIEGVKETLKTHNIPPTQAFKLTADRKLFLPSTPTASLALWLRRPPRERKVPGSNPACAGIFSGSSHTSDFKIGTPVATLPGAWCYRVSTGTGRPGVSILWLGEVERWICSFYLSVAARKIVWADPSLRYTSLLLGR